MFVHLHFSNMGVSLVLVSRGQTLFFAQGRYRFQYKRGAYTESDNAPARKIGSGHARLP